MVEEFNYLKKSIGPPGEMPETCGSCFSKILLPDKLSVSVGWYFVKGKYKCNKCHGDIFNE